MGTDENEVRGRVVRFLTTHQVDYPTVEQWFLVGIDDDQKAIEAVSGDRSAGEIVEIVGHITPTIAAQWNLRPGDIRLVLPGEPILIR